MERREARKISLWRCGRKKERKKGGGIEHKDVEERWAKKGVEWK